MATARSVALEESGSARTRAMRLVFILSCHIRSVFDGRILSIVLFALRRFHPTCKVVIVDNASPARITHERLPADDWNRRHNVAIVLNSPSLTREYGAYDKGVRFLAAAAGQWNLERHDQFVFMQGSIILTEPVPSITAGRCAMKPLFVFSEAKTPFIQYMSGVFDRMGLKNTAGGVKNEPFVSHSSSVATLDAVRLLLHPPRGNQSVFGAATVKIASKMLAEQAAGVIVNRVSLAISNGTATDCATRPVAWRGSRSGYREDAKAQYRSMPVGYRKVHCSDWQHTSPSDAAFAAMVSGADDSQDGLISRGELKQFFVQRQTAAQALMKAACLSFPIGPDARLRRFVERGPAWPGVGKPLADAVLSARHAHAGIPRGAVGSACLFWAEEALAWQFALPASPTMLNAGIEPFGQSLLGSLTRPLSAEESFWRQTEKLRNASSASTPEAARLAHELAAALFALVDDDKDGFVSFEDLKAASDQRGAVGSALLPLCWRAGAWLGIEREGGPGSALSVGLPKLTSDQLASIDYEARLHKLQTEFVRTKVFHNWHTSEELAPALNAASLLYAKAALCCLRSCDADGKRAIGGATGGAGDGECQSCYPSSFPKSSHAGM